MGNVLPTCITRICWPSFVGVHAVTFESTMVSGKLNLADASSIISLITSLLTHFLPSHLLCNCALSNSSVAKLLASIVLA